MTGLQFSLFFAAILIAYTLVHLRLVRFENYLRRISGLQMIDDRLRTLADSLEVVDLERVEARLGELHDDLRDVVDGQARIERALASRAAVRQAVPGDSGGDGEPDVSSEEALVELERYRSGGREANPLPGAVVARRAVEVTLFGTGHRKLRILTDLEQAIADAGGPGQDIEIVVECERDGMPVKGRLVVRGDAVLDVDLRSAHAMFP